MLSPAAAKRSNTVAYRIEGSITIAAPPEVVWNVVQDVSRRIEWDARVRSVTLQTPLPMGKGSRTLIDYASMGLPMQIEIEMVSWQPPRRSGVRGQVLGTADTVAGSWNFEQQADGATTWTTRIVLTSQGRFAWLREQVMGRYTAYLTAVSQRNLKRLIEGEARAAQVAKAES